MARASTEATLSYGILVAVAVFTALPLLGVVSLALAPPGKAAEAFRFAHRLDFSNFAHAWHLGDFSTYMLNSMVVAVLTVVMCVTLGILAGYGFGTMSFRGSTALFYLILLGLLVPEEAIIVPLYFGFRSIGLTNSYISLILPQVGLSLGFCVFWMRAFFRSIPAALLSAARLDGAGSLTILRSILLPQAGPTVTTAVVLTFLWTWNEFLIPLVMVTSQSLRTAPLGLDLFQGEYTTELALLSAASIIVAAPVVMLFLVVQRPVLRGMLSGAIKE